jgi:uncharacterized membrane protein
MNWQPLYPIATYVLLAAVIIGLLITARRIAVSTKTRGWILFALRGGVMAALVFLLLNPIDLRETVLPPRPPSVALLVDCSQSMALGVGQSRLEGVKGTIDSVSRWMGTQRPMQLPLFRFGKQLSKVPSVAELNANEDASLLGQALERLPSRIAGDQARAVILFSDGAVPKTEQLAKIATAYRKLKIPIHTMVSDVGDLRGDVAISKLAVPQRVAAGDQATISAVIESRGYDQERLLVTVRPADRPNAAPLASLPITLHDGSTPLELIVTADPSLGDLVIEIPVLEGEAVASNNRIPFRLAERDRELSVLYMEGTSGGEYRWLRDALQEDSDIRCVPMVVNNQYATRPSLQRVEDRFRGFPATREELFKFDVVICSDILRGAFTPEQIQWTVELVDKRGGGFVMIGGHTSFGSGNWDSTSWDQLIPFDMTNRRDYLNQSFSVTVPAGAQSHPIWQLLEDPEKNRAALEAMPRFTGTNLISRVKPAATLLGRTSTPLSRVGIMPVFACETFGRGRTFAMSTDTTQSWGRYFESQWGEGDNRYYRKFWRNVIRWLAENSRASQRRLIVHTDQVIYSPGEPIQVVAEAFDRDFRSTTDYRVTARLVSADSEELDETETAADQAVTMHAQPTLEHYTAAVPAMLTARKLDVSNPMQKATLIVTAWEGDQEVAVESVPLQLLHDSSEWLRPQSQPETLRMVAEAGGGGLLSSDRELRRLLQSFDATPGEVLVHKLPLWDRWPVWAFLLGLLAIEWTLRRRGESPPAVGPG